ncbi:MAG: T9SS type A sorting domain-containing protein [Bacteroidota bacterium]
MNNKNINIFLSIIFISTSILYPQTIGKVSPIEVYSKFNINNISTLIHNNGKADASDQRSSFNYPKGTYKTAVYMSGFVWGAKIDQRVRVGGSTFTSGLLPGKIISNRLAEDPNSYNARVFRVRRDFKSADLSMEAEDEGKTIQQVYDQYEKDWNEWRANDGAPFEDIDGNRIYNPLIDVPGFPGADQTLWFVANDLDSNQTKYLYGSPTMGIEMQVTVWGYDGVEPIGNTIFKRYLLINKSEKEFKEMYVGIWSDPDLGGAGDDLVGCDTLLNLGYVYNGDDNDTEYGFNVPSLGFLLLQGPLVEGGIASYGTFKGNRISGKHNLPMTAFAFIYKNGPDPWNNPNLFEYRGTLEMYNNLQGLLNDGRPHPFPIGFDSGSTVFPYSGDPVSGTGFIGGVYLPDSTLTLGRIRDYPGDHRLMVCSGPFNMMPGDTQEVIFAQVIAGGTEDVDRLGAINLLKDYSQALKDLFKSGTINIPTVKVPDVNNVELDKKIVLHWGENESVKNVESAGNSAYKFQGYNIYQLPREYSKLEEWKKVATFDVIDGVGEVRDYIYDFDDRKIQLKLRQTGKDSGIQRFVEIDYDYLHNKYLSNGSTYYFAVTSYITSNDLSLSPNNYESEPYVVAVMPHSFNPGTIVHQNYGGEITASHLSGSSDAVVKAVVIDPYKFNGHEYEITFQNNSGLNWKLFDITDNKEIFTSQKNFSGDNDYLIADGLMFVVKEGTENKLTTDDIYKLTAPEITYNQKQAEVDVEKINVFPNPYYCASVQQIDKYDRFVTFTHLPNKATIRIFNLAGQLVRKLEKDNSDQFVRWDMLNESRFIVPSGLYIVHIEMPEVGKSKVLKLAVLYEQLVPDHY